MTNKLLTIFGTLVSLSSSAVIAEEVEFRLKFEPGKTYLTESMVTQNTVLPMGGQKIESKMGITGVSSQKVIKVGENVEVVQKMDSLKMEVNAGGMAMEFDSEKPEGMMAATFAPLLEAETTMVVGPDGRVVSVKAKAVPGMEALGMGDEEMKRSAREMSDMMPNKKVSVGESWKSESVLPLPGITDKPATIVYTMTFDSIVEVEGRKLAKVVAKGVVNEDDGNLRVTSKEVGGVILFDPEIGQARKSTLTLDIEIGLPEGEVAVEGAPGKMPMKMETVSTLKEIKDTEK